MKRYIFGQILVHVEKIWRIRQKTKTLDKYNSRYKNRTINILVSGQHIMEERLEKYGNLGGEGLYETPD